MKLIILLAICLSVELALSSVVVSPIEGGQTLSVFHSNGDLRLRGQLGNLPRVVRSPTTCGEGCYSYMDYANLTIEENGDCTTVQWLSDFSKDLRDCFLIENHWYGGGETNIQYWPIERLQRWEAPFVTGDSFSNGEWDYGGVSENYWLVSSGVGIYVDDDVPLFVSTNDKMENHVCFAAKRLYPFKERTGALKLRYTMCTADNVKAAHILMHERFLDKPVGIPDTGMLLRPFWSTWAQFKENVSETIVVDFAQTILDQGFNSSHIEIDDNWETCYGNAEFNSERFPDVRRMVTRLNDMGYRVTLWIHPFVDLECSAFAEGHREGYFVQTDKGKTGITSWWQGRNSGLVDYTNDAAVAWWVGRLERIRQDFGIDSFKFDAGETNWMPYAGVVRGDRDLMPNLYSQVFAEVMASFGGLVEVRTVRKSQRFPMFVRMLDKDSRWGYNNGLKSLIPSLLHFGIQGYPFVLPDMIGGNAYVAEGKPPRQLYIRWMQANVLMPSVQFSIAPWDYDDEVVEICKEVLQIRKDFEDVILDAARQSVVDGSPINRPLWWVDPNDPVTHTVDDQYLLGDRIMVAPVVEEDANTRNIYLPVGQWRSLSQNVSYEGPIWLNDYPADIRTLPIFLKDVSK